MTYCRHESTNNYYLLLLIAIPCDELPVPDNGNIMFSNTMLAGFEANYSCNAGYTLLGNSLRTCSSASTWSGSPPSCIALSGKCRNSYLVLSSMMLIARCHEIRA